MLDCLVITGMSDRIVASCQIHQCFWISETSRCRVRTLTYLLTYLLTPWCRVLLEKLTGLQLVKKFPAFYGIRRFITVLTSVRHLSLSWANPIHSTYPHLTSWRFILILSTHLHLGLPSGLFPSGFPTKTLYTPLSSPIRTQLYEILGQPVVGLSDRMNTNTNSRCV